MSAKWFRRSMRWRAATTFTAVLLFVAQANHSIFTPLLWLAFAIVWGRAEYWYGRSAPLPEGTQP